jgi:hypothetical protein
MVLTFQYQTFSSTMLQKKILQRFYCESMELDSMKWRLLFSCRNGLYVLSRFNLTFWFQSTLWSAPECAGLRCLVFGRAASVLSKVFSVFSGPQEGPCNWDWSNLRVRLHFQKDFFSDCLTSARGRSPPTPRWLDWRLQIRTCKSAHLADFAHTPKQLDYKLQKKTKSRI